MSLNRSRAVAAKMAPMTPSGITSITDNRDRPAFIERRQAEIDDEDGEAHTGPAPGHRRPASWKDRPVNSYPTPGGSFWNSLSISASAVPVLMPVRRHALNFDGGKAIIAGECGGPTVQFAVAKEEKGAMVPVVVRTYQRSRSCGVMRNGASPWMIDTLDAGAVDEIVDEVAAPGRRQGGVGVGGGDAQRVGLVLVDVDMQLWRVVQAVGKDLPEHWVVRRQAQQHVARLHQCRHGRDCRDPPSGFRSRWNCPVPAPPAAPGEHLGSRQHHEFHIGAGGDGAGAVWRCRDARPSHGSG